MQEELKKLSRIKKQKEEENSKKRGKIKEKDKRQIEKN